MTFHNVVINGAGIVDKHTHYEAYVAVGSIAVTIQIREDIAAEFHKKYGVPITQASRMNVVVDLVKNDQKIKECQNPFRSPLALVGSIDTIDDICSVTR